MKDWEKELSVSTDRLLSIETAPNLAESIRYSLISGGKHFRPRLMEASAQLLEVSEAAFTPFAVALEMIHTFTLIHDDLPCMDNDDIRRGKPSNHKVFGEALALLAGDALVPMAFENCLSARPHASVVGWSEALARLLELSGPRGVIGGQALEMLIQDSTSLGNLREMHALKTGALFDAAILIPADLALLGSSPERMQALRSFAHSFGLAFQTADDLDDAQDEREQNFGVYPKTNVLHYLTVDEALHTASTSLTSATSQIESLWPKTHRDLTLIAGQLQKNLSLAALKARSA